MPVKKKVVRILALFCLSLILLLGLLHLGFIRRLTLNLSLHYLEKNFGLSVQAAALDYNLLTFRFTLRKIALRHPEDLSLPVFFAAEQASVKISPSLFFKKKIYFKELTVQKPEFNFEISEEGVMSLPFKSRTGLKEGFRAKPALPEFILENGFFHDAVIIFNDKARGLRIVSPTIDLGARWVGEGVHEISGKARKSGDIDYRGHRLPIKTLDLKADFGLDKVILKEFRLIILRHEFSATGMVKDYLTPVFDLDLEARIDLEGLRPVLRVDLKPGGTAKVKARLQGPLSALTARAEVLADNLSYNELRGLVLRGELLWEQNTLNLPSFEIAVPGGKIKGAGMARLNAGFDLDKSQLSGKYEADIEHLGEFWAGLRSALQSLKMKAPDLGEVSGRIHLAGQVDGPAQSPRLIARLTGNQVFVAGFKDLGFNGTLTYERKSIRITPLHISIRDGEINLEGAYSPDFPSPLDLKVEAKQLPTEVIGKALGWKYVPQGILELKTVIAGPPDAPTFDFKAALSDLVYREVKIPEVRLEARAELRGDFMRFKETFGLSVRGENLHLRTDALELANDSEFSVYYSRDGLAVKDMKLKDVSSQGTTLRAEGHLPLRDVSDSEIRLLARVELERLAALIPGMEGRGILTVDSRVGGSVREPQVRASVNVPGATWKFNDTFQPVEDIQASLEIFGNTIAVHSLSFHWESGHYRLKGEIPFESLPFDLPSLPPEPKEREANLTLTVSRFKPSDLGVILGNETLGQINGELDAEVEIRGESLSLDRLFAAARISGFDLDFNGLPLALESPCQVNYRRGRLSLETTRLMAKGGSFQAEGWMDLLDEKDLFLSLRGGLELGALPPFLEEARISGKTAFEIEIDGQMPQLKLDGILELDEVVFDLAVPSISLSRLNGRISLSQNRIILAGISGELNGGRIGINGEIDHASLRLTGADIRLSAERVFFDYPAGLFSESNADLRFVSSGERHTLSGKVSLAAEYVEDLSVQSELSRYLRRRGARPLRERTRSEFLNSLNFNIQVVTPGSISIHNNVLKADLNADLRVTGTPYQLGLAGRFLFSDGGEVYFSRRRYQIEHGEINFINPGRIEPDLDIRAHTRVSGYDIQLLISGRPDDLSARLISSPPLPEPDIIALLMTGRRLAYISEAGLRFVSDQALSYVNDAITGQLEKLAEQKLGFQNVTIDAGLVSAQENPEARITIGQQVTPKIDLVVSQNLKKSQFRTVIVNFSPVRDVNLRGIKKDNDEYRLETHHEIRFGLKKDPMRTAAAERKAVLVESVVFEGNTGLGEKELRRRLSLSPGKRFDLVAYRKDLMALRRLYEKSGYLSSTIRPRREERDGKINLVYRIESGPTVDLRYEGAAVPQNLKKQIKRVWIEGRFQKQILEKGGNLLRRHFHRRGYYQARVEPRESRLGESRITVAFHLFPGPRYKDLQLRFDGNKALSDAYLASFFRRNKLALEALADPQKAAGSLKNFYVERGFLRAEAGPAKIEFHPEERTALVKLAVSEGPRFKVDAMTFSGNRHLSGEKLLESVKIQSGSVFSFRNADDALSILGSAYAGQGFNRAEIREHIRVDEETAGVSLTWEIKESEQDIVQDVAVTGNAVTDMSTIRRELACTPGEALDYFRLHKSQKSLYDLQIFERVTFALTPLGERKDDQDKKQYYRVEFNVAEMKPWVFRYGLQYDTETGAGGAGEIVNRNFFGRAQLIGASFNLNRREEGVKAFFRSHYFLGEKINTEVFGFVNRSTQPGFSLDRCGFTVQQQLRLTELWFFSYNYTLERTRIFEAEPDLSARDHPMNVGRMSANLSHDTRDDIMNPGQGAFFSLNVDYAAQALGSDRKFIRSFGQFSFVKKIRGALSYASGLRIGLGKGFGHDLPLSERFFAGGGTSIRGFSLNEAGPKAPESRLPVGGEALFILNQEIRYSLYKQLGGVAFLDLGNVYPRVSDFSPLTIRKAVGVGLRLNTPIFLFRLDLGFKLDRRPGESLSKLHFSIGQAF